MFFYKITLNKYNNDEIKLYRFERKKSVAGGGKHHQGCTADTQWQLKYQVKMSKCAV